MDIPIFLIALPSQTGEALAREFEFEPFSQSSGIGTGALVLTEGDRVTCLHRRALLSYLLASEIPCAAGFGPIHDPAIHYLPGLQSKGRVIHDEAWTSGWHIYDYLSECETEGPNAREENEAQCCKYDAVLKNQDGWFYKTLMRNTLDSLNGII